MDELECTTLLAADRVIREDNGKFSIIGVFKNINLPQFPAVIAPWHVYAHVNGLPKTGNVAVTITIYNIETTLVVLSQNFDIPEDQRKGDDLDINLQVANVVFQKPGRHAVSINVNGKNLKFYYLDVNQIGSVS